MPATISLYEEVSAAHPEWAGERIIHAICEQMLDEADAAPPVDVEILASICGIEDIEYRSEGPAGMLVCKDDVWVASVLSTDGLERQRFTILHEGGHTFQPDFRRSVKYHRCKGPRTREERLCDLAAAEMLLPRRFFVADLADVGLPDLDAVEELARAYCASHEATTRRTVDLAAHPIGMMVFHFGHKPDDRGHEHIRDPKVRLEYAYSDDNLPFPLRHKSVARDSVFHRAWEYELVDEISNVDEYFADQVGPTRVSARRYGDKVIALVQPVRPGEG